MPRNLIREQNLEGIIIMTQTATEPQVQTQIPNEDMIIKCAGLTKIFKDFWMRPRVTAVDKINLDVRRGEVFGLLGPNGSGKSTTIKMILGLLNPSFGRIAVFGKRPEDVATKKMIGYLPEESYLYRFLNARETLDYYGRLFHQSRAQRSSRIDMLLEMVGLAAVQRRLVGEYSKGMQRRIGLAQALINDPQLLILDEPTTGLDPIGTRQIKDLILELSRRGKTILLCSHLLSDVEDVCDRVAIMFGGKVRQEGACDELLVQQDKTTLQTPKLDDQAIAEIDQVLAKRGMAIESRSEPRESLESLFLDIVATAEAEGLTTAGSQSGGQIADFLVDESAVEPVSGDELIDQLIAQPTVAPVEQTSPQQLESEQEQVPSTDEQLIGNLMEQPSVQTDTQAPEETQQQVANETDSSRTDRSIIDDLLGNKEENEPKG
jgi:ABC-2 type transport system ATP-binding protein